MKWASMPRTYCWLKFVGEHRGCITTQYSADNFNPVVGTLLIFGMKARTNSACSSTNALMNHFPWHISHLKKERNTFL
jgi:hypothetical protein